MTQLIRMAIRAEGIVQGVGFRPFVYTLATGLGLTGHVGNDADGVFAEIEGPAAAVSKFLLALERDAPPLARQAGPRPKDALYHCAQKPRNMTANARPGDL